MANASVSRADRTTSAVLGLQHAAMCRRSLVQLRKIRAGAGWLCGSLDECMVVRFEHARATCRSSQRSGTPARGAQPWPPRPSSWTSPARLQP